MEAVVGQHDHRHGRVAKVLRQVEHEAVVVDENGVEVLVEELLGDRAFEFVEPQIQELELRQMQHHLGELSGEPVVAEIQLEEEFELVELVRHGAAEAVGVDVEERKVSEQAELLREISGNVAVVEVDSGDGADLRVVQCLSAEDVAVVADIGPHPV